MKRYFFHLHACGDITTDAIGQDLVDMASALQTAIRKAWQVMAAEVAAGRLCLLCHIEIEDGVTGERTPVPFREALRITGT